jgi:hypothetical protein
MQKGCCLRHGRPLLHPMLLLLLLLLLRLPQRLLSCRLQCG